MRFLIIFSVSIWLLTACDPITTYHQKLVNNTSHTIIGERFNSPEDTVFIESFTIPPNTTQTISSLNTISKVNYYKNCPNYNYFEFSVKDNDSLEVLLNIDNPVEWVFIENSKATISGGGECTCEIILNDSQIE